MIFSLMAMSIVPFANAQATGNDTYNENNRFKNNGYYKAEDKAAPAAAYRSDDYDGVEAVAVRSAANGKKRMATNQAQWNYGDAAASQGNLLINQVQNNLSSYYDGSDFLVRVHVLYNAAPTSYMAIFHLNQAGKKVQDIDSLMSNGLSLAARTLSRLEARHHVRREQFQHFVCHQVSATHAQGVARVWRIPRERFHNIYATHGNMGPASVLYCLHDAVHSGRIQPGHVVVMRGAGVGREVLFALMDAARKRGEHEVVLHAQRSAEAFYARLGYTVNGEPFEEAGIPHIEMQMRL